MAETACPIGNQCKLTTLPSHSVNGKAYVEEFDDIGRPYLKEVKV